MADRLTGVDLERYGRALRMFDGRSALDFVHRLLGCCRLQGNSIQYQTATTGYPCWFKDHLCDKDYAQFIRHI